jgi:hypothetical protein
MIVVVRPSNNLPMPPRNAGVSNCTSTELVGQKNMVTSLAGPRFNMSVPVRASSNLIDLTRNTVGG